MNVTKMAACLFLVYLLTVGALAESPLPVKNQTPAAVAPVPSPLKPMSDHLLATNAEWRQYYGVAPQDQVQVYFNITVLLDAVRQQTAQIAALQTRIKALEAKLADQVTIEKKAPDQPDP